MFRSRVPLCLALTPFLLLGAAVWRVPNTASNPSFAPGPRVFCWSPELLSKSRERLAGGDPARRPALDRLLADADRALAVNPVSVVDKTRTPPSGDKHDYMSLAPYFWPDPTKKDRLPYIRKDGERNPESGGGNSDSSRFGRMGSAVETLSLAYYFSGREAYAEHAARLLRAWFLDPATRMNPNLNYAQAVPGRVNGRGTGIIETVRLIGIVDSIGLLGGSRAWTAQDQDGIVYWMKQYLEWLQTSGNGRAERRASNNHGTYYDAQVVSLALLTGQHDLARRVLRGAGERRIGAQIMPDGSQPRELARTRSFSYSVYNLTAMEDLADLGEREGIDLWRYQTPDGRSIRKAIDFLAPYADPNRRWPFKQITPLDRGSLYADLLQADLHYHDQAYRRWINCLPAEDRAQSRATLLYANGM